jgi:polysaccharide export outer membrane protein
MKKTINFISKWGLGLLILVFAISCVPTKELSYFNDINELQEPVVNPKIQKTIMPFDRLYIKVLSIDPQTSQIFNTSEEIRYSTEGNSMIGYLVDEAGEINFPFVGKINVGSLTTSQAAVKVQGALNDYVANTSLIVKFIDNQVSVIGEVQRQGVFSFSQDKLNIYEALALGGGLTRYGNRKNVILIRQEGDKIMHHKLNLADSKIASKEYYYVLPNDVIVVEPLNSISTSYQNNTYTTILTSITTLIAVLLFTGVRF